MADDAGFAVALTIRERLLNDALLVAYTGNGFPRSLAATLPDGPPGASIDVFLAPPRITCRANGALTLTVRMWGRLTATIGAVEETRNVAANLTLRLRPSFAVEGTNLVLRFGNVDQDVSATDWSFAVISGGGFSPDADSYLHSMAFRDRLQHAIRLAIQFGVVRLPRINISFLGPILDVVNNTTAQSRVVDGALVLGLDIQSDEVMTSGDVSRLADFARDHDVAAVTSAVAVPALLHKVRSQLKDEVAKTGATLDGDVQITAQAGRFHVEAHASNSTGSAAFSFNLIPALYASRAGTTFQYLQKPLHVNPRIWPALGFTTADVQVDVDLATWVVIVTVVATVINVAIPLIIARMVSDTAAHLTNTIAGANTGEPVPRVQHLKPSTTGGAGLRIAIEAYEISTLGTYIGITARPQLSPGLLLGLTSIPSNFRAQKLGYTVRLPLGVQLDDPALRIRWTVIDPAGTVLVNDDGVAAGRATFTFVPETVAPGRSELNVGVRVYRVLGAEITDFVNDGIALAIRGPLAPGAYVRWYYDVKNPQVQFDEHRQAWAYTGDRLAKRYSNLHRTDRPCANASKSSRYTYRTDVLDALPFAIADIALHRPELCDYCFYGSPAGLRPSL